MADVKRQIGVAHGQDGHSHGRPRRHGQPQLGPVADDVLRRQWQRPRVRADQLPAQSDEVAYIVEHSGARCLLIDPEVAD